MLLQLFSDNIVDTLHWYITEKEYYALYTNYLNVYFTGSLNITFKQLFISIKFDRNE